MSGGIAGGSVPITHSGPRIDPLLFKLNYETVEITQEMIFMAPVTYARYT